MVELDKYGFKKVEPISPTATEAMRGDVEHGNVTQLLDIEEKDKNIPLTDDVNNLSDRLAQTPS